MAHNHDKNRYAKAVGHAAIEWNYLEHDLNRIGHYYLKIDGEDAAQIFALMGNVSRANLVGYLARKYELRSSVRDHIQYLLKIYSILRWNRNIVEHGVPAVTASGDYMDAIIKIDRRGAAMPFAASTPTLDQFLNELGQARAFALSILDCLDNQDADHSAIERPPMPEKLDQLSFRKEG